ncbi:MAG: enoyl-CoA hydratase/isomerase family protein [Oricola sp.]
MSGTAGGDLLVWRDGAAGRLRLNRPKALNALTHDMARGIENALLAWREDDTVGLVIIDAAGDKAFCAGGDIQQLYALGKAGDYEPARRFWAEEYRLNALIANYPKPYVAIMDGITMGGGVGVGAHGSHRIVTGRTTLAMPEVGIGFLPDVGGTWLLSRAPGRTGYYLGMTGARMDAADAIYAGFADNYIESDRLEAFAARLVETANVDAAIAEFASEPPAGTLAAARAEIDDAFGRENPLAIADRLDIMATGGSEWAASALKALRRTAPLSVASTFEAVRRAEGFSSIEQCLALEYRFSHRVLEGHDFLEGVRAAVIDKDRNPDWQPKRLEDITPDMVETMLGPLGDAEWKPQEEADE